MNTLKSIFFIAVIIVLCYVGVQLRSGAVPPSFLGDQAYSSLVLIVAFSLIIYVVSNSSCEMFKLPKKTKNNSKKKN